ncbi:hypothetical protein OAV12_00670 [bacterium]|nr:hypothetical protein [bacterium]MDC3317680.1 hypothetical protein [bacterium]
MSKIALTPNGSGSGVFTIASPNSNTNRTITLPDESITLGAGSPSIDDNGNATALTIDSDENVLIGTTDINPYDNTTGSGIALRSSGAIYNAINNGTPLNLNRMGSDGTIAQFRKDGAAVGNIGVVSDDRMYFATADGLGLQFDKDNNRIIPCDATGGYNSNVELGDEGLAFTNLFLTGGIQFDSRSSKLEDYEEGTFTPAVENGWGVLNPTYNTRSGYYTKVGNKVYIVFHIILSGGSLNGNKLQLNGFPFSVANTGVAESTLNGFFYTASSQQATPMFVMASNGTTGSFVRRTTTNRTNFTGNDAGNGFNLSFSGTYLTDQ